MHEYKIIGVAKVVPDLQVMFGELIQLIQIHIREKLAAEIPNGQPAHIPGSKQRFVGRDMAPERPVPLEDHVLGTVMKDNRPGQPPERIIVNPLGHQVIQNRFVNVEKEALNIELQRIARPGPIVRDAPHERLQATARPGASPCLSGRHRSHE